MASNYHNLFKVPPNFPEILSDFAQEVLHEAPEDILLYAYEYFEAKAHKREFNRIAYKNSLKAGIE